MKQADSDNEQEQFAAHYTQMNDGELLEIALRPWALSDAAWDALEDELDRRELDLPEPEGLPGITVPEKRHLVTVRRFRDLPEALLAKGSIESAGIESFLSDDNMVRMDWFISNLLGGVKLLVDASDFSEVVRILNEPIPQELEVDGVGCYVQPQCPLCGSLDIAFAELNKRVSYTSAWLGLPVPLLRDDWLCHACGHRWQEPPADTPDA
jgi:hypothetical protein